MKNLVIAFLVLTGSALGITKQEMLDTLSTRFDVVGTPKLVSDILPGYNVKWYQVPIFDVRNDNTAIGRSFDMYVKNEGLGDESAYAGKNIATTPIDVFTPAVRGYLVGESIILRTMIKIDIDALWAECQVWEWDSLGDVFIAKKVLVRKVGQNLVHKDIQ